jgi:RNA polymerase sigma-70 factor, ECF subfamily
MLAPTPSPPADPAHADVDAARSGDRAAFARLHQRYAPVVHAILLSRLPSADADDLTQEVFLTAMRRLSDLRDAAAIGPWLSAIARNAAASLARSRPRGMSAGLPDSVPSGGAGPRENSEAAEALGAIRELPEAYRETLLMRLVVGLTGPEIAARTGMTHGSVRVNLHRGMALLRERLGAATAGESA